METVRYLGVHLDTKLSGVRHAKKAAEKAAKHTIALRGIARSSWGVGLEHMLQLYKAVILPKLSFACSTWYCPYATYGHKGTRDDVLRKAQQAQHDGLRAASGAIKQTALAAIEAELHVRPIQNKLEQDAINTATRIIGSPVFELIRRIREDTRGTARYRP